MPYVDPLNKEQAPEAARPLLDAIESKYGKVLNIFGTMAHQPGVLKGVASINEGLQDSLPPKYRELAYYKSSRINDCDYCSHYHKQAARQAGVSDAQLNAIDNYADSSEFDDREKAVLAYAEQLTKTAGVDEGTVRSLQDFLNDVDLVTLAAAVALANFTNRFNHGLGIELP